MANKKLVVISYCFAFLSIYFCSIAYALISESINVAYNMELPQTIAMNATITGLSSFSSWQGTLVTVGIMTIILTIILIIISSRAMSSAI